LVCWYLVVNGVRVFPQTRLRRQGPEESEGRRCRKKYTGIQGLREQETHTFMEKSFSGKVKLRGPPRTYMGQGGIAVCSKGFWWPTGAK